MEVKEGQGGEEIIKGSQFIRDGTWGFFAFGPGLLCVLFPPCNPGRGSKTAIEETCVIAYAWIVVKLQTGDSCAVFRVKTTKLS